MAGAFRRSELVALTLADLQRVLEGLRVTIRRSKTDQEGAGAVIAIPEGWQLRPKALLEAWIDQAGVADGFVLRRLGVGGTVRPQPMSDCAIARMVQSCAAAAGYTTRHDGLETRDAGWFRRRFPVHDRAGRAR